MRILAKDTRQKKTPQPYDAHDKTGCVMFDSPELATDALSLAILTHCRDEAEKIRRR